MEFRQCTTHITTDSARLRVVHARCGWVCTFQGVEKLNYSSSVQRNGHMTISVVMNRIRLRVPTYPK